MSVGPCELVRFCVCMRVSERARVSVFVRVIERSTQTGVGGGGGGEREGKWWWGGGGGGQ